MENKENACCEINPHGRLLSANKKFCRLFGFSAEEIEWHYIRDLFRYEQNWSAFIKNTAAQTAHFIVRLKNRKGRSFIASISRETGTCGGKTVFYSTIRKISELAEVPEATEVLKEPEFEPDCIAL